MICKKRFTLPTSRGRTSPHTFPNVLGVGAGSIDRGTLLAHERGAELRHPDETAPINLVDLRTDSTLKVCLRVPVQTEKGDRIFPKSGLSFCNALESVLPRQRQVETP